MISIQAKALGSNQPTQFNDQPSQKGPWIVADDKDQLDPLPALRSETSSPDADGYITPILPQHLQFPATTHELDLSTLPKQSEELDQLDSQPQEEVEQIDKEQIISSSPTSAPSYVVLKQHQHHHSSHSPQNPQLIDRLSKESDPFVRVRERAKTMYENV